MMESAAGVRKESFQAGLSLMCFSFYEKSGNQELSNINCKLMNNHATCFASQVFHCLLCVCVCVGIASGRWTGASEARMPLKPRRGGDSGHRPKSH